MYIVVLLFRHVSCVNSPNLFRYICNEFPPIHRQSVTPTMKKSYELYFGCKMWAAGRVWPHIQVAVVLRHIYAAG